MFEDVRVVPTPPGVPTNGSLASTDLAALGAELQAEGDTVGLRELLEGAILAIFRPQGRGQERPGPGARADRLEGRGAGGPAGQGQDDRDRAVHLKRIMSTETERLDLRPDWSWVWEMVEEAEYVEEFESGEAEVVDLNAWREERS